MMVKSKIVMRKRELEKAISLNKYVIDYDPSPHKRDEARCRIKILKRKLKYLEGRIPLK